MRYQKSRRCPPVFGLVRPRTGWVKLLLALVIAASTAIGSAGAVLAASGVDSGDTRSDAPLKVSAPRVLPKLQAGALAFTPGGTRVWMTDSGYDLDQYLFYEDVAPPGDGYLDFGIDVDDSVTPDNYVLVMSTYDVDETSGNPAGPEVDRVYFNGHFVGTLSGASDSWSISAFYLSPSWIDGGSPASPGTNQVQVDVDVLTRSDWAVEVDWGAIVAGEAWGQGMSVGSCSAWSDSGVDADQNGLFDVLRVEIPITVDTGMGSQPYEWNAALTDADGEEIVWATGYATLGEGLQEVQLDFPGTDVYAFGVDGPYRVRNFSIYNPADRTVFATYIQPCGTGAYDWGQFEQSYVFRVRSVMPPDGGTAPPGSNVEVTFTGDVDEATLDSSTFFVTGSNGDRVPGPITYDAASRTATFDPADPLTAGMTYFITATRGILDTYGNPLEYIFDSGFTVGFSVDGLVAMPNVATRYVYFRYNLPNAREIELKVYDVTGRLVHRASLAPSASGESVWDLTADNGLPLASGLYLYTAVVDGTPARPGRLFIQR